MTELEKDKGRKRDRKAERDNDRKTTTERQQEE